MRAVLFSMLLSAGLALVSSNPASAAPLSGAALTKAGQQSGVLLVRDGCGRDRHFSKWRGICVWNGARSYGYVAPYRYLAPAYGYGYYGPPVYGPGFYGPGYGFYRRW